MNMKYSLFVKLKVTLCSMRIVNIREAIKGSERDVVYLGWPTTPSYTIPNAGARGGGGCGCGVSANEYITWWWSPTKLWRSTVTPYLTNVGYVRTKSWCVGRWPNNNELFKEDWPHTADFAILSSYFFYFFSCNLSMLQKIKKIIWDEPRFSLLGYSN